MADFESSPFKNVRSPRSEDPQPPDISHLNGPAQSRLDQLLGSVDEELEIQATGSFRPNIIATTWRNLAAYVCPSTRSPSALLEDPNLKSKLPNYLQALRFAAAHKQSDAQALLDIAMGCVLLRVRDEQLLQTISIKAQSILSTFNTDQLANLTWALVRLSYQDETFFEDVSALAIQRGNQFSARSRAILAWSLGLAEGPTSLEFVRDSYAILLQSRDPSELLQVHQAAAARGIVPPNLPREITAKIKTHKFTPRSNRFERSVRAILQKLHSTQVIDAIVPRFEIAGIETDFVIVAAGAQWVVECDGSRFHHINSPRDGAKQPVGNDLIQDKILKRAGYKVLHILDQVWSSLTNEEDRTGYLKAALAGT